jgi:pSer/pThr/pTyr-binding forkhead associated (FHA) protein
VIGRTEDAVAWNESTSASRRHARILVSGGKATLEDFGSKNGTFVEGRKVTSPVALADVEEIRVGLVPLLIRVLAAAPSTRTVAKG